MSWVVKVGALALGVGMACAAQARDVYVLALGESLASNCNEHVYGPSAGVYQLTTDGIERLAADPLDGADCRKGSVWMPLAREMLAAGMADRVVLVPVGVTGHKVADWRVGGVAHARLQSTLKRARARGIHFDFALWQQGEHESRTSRDDYRGAMSVILTAVSVEVDVQHWLVAKQSSCGGQSFPAVGAAQLDVAHNHVLRRFSGPDADRLGPEFRVDGCVLNHAGQEEMARRWVTAMQSAQHAAEHVEKESLLHYFRWDLAKWLAPKADERASARVATVR